MCESLAVRRDKWRLNRRKQKFAEIKMELYQMEDEIKDVRNVPQLRKAIEHFSVLLEDMEVNSIKFVKVKTK